MRMPIRSFLLAGLFVAPAVSFAQVPATRPAVPGQFDEAMWRNRSTVLINRWRPNFEDIYSLNADQKAQFGKMLDQIAESDIKFNKESQLEQTKAREEVSKLFAQLNDPKNGAKDPTERQRIQRELQQSQQKLLSISTGAPLTVDKIADALEKTLPKDQAAKGHAQFLLRRPYGLRPVPTSTPLAAQPPNAAAQPHPTAPAMPTDPHLANPTRFRQPLLVAPPLGRWPGIVERLIAERKYTPDQMGRCRAILKDLQARANAETKGTDADVATAMKIADRLERDKKLKDILAPLDLSYDELIQRVDQIARADQLDPVTRARPAAAPPVDRWPTAIDRIISARLYNDKQAAESRNMMTEAMKKGDAYVASNGAQLADLSKDASFATLDKMYQELVASVEKLGPAPAPPAVMPMPGGAAGGH